MRIALALFAAATLWSSDALAFTVTGRFLYEDRKFDESGYTGATQNMPIRHARVDVVNAVTQQSLATGVTDADGNYSLVVTGQIVPVNLFVRCRTDARPSGYFIQVVDGFVRVPGEGLVLTQSMIYAISTTTVVAHNPANDLDLGTFLTEETDGTSVAQAFHILDTGVDFFDWVATVKGSLPDSTEFVVYAWTPAGSPGNPNPTVSNYSQQGIFIGADPGTDSDGWSDTVILHETGHWFDDVYSRSDNPGGTHFLGDNDANVLLAYGEGSATYHCGKVREWRSSRLNVSGQPFERLVSLYADLLLPTPDGTPGGLSFSYDFETGNLWIPPTVANQPIGQRGTANETNVTSALWDLLDGPGTPDATVGTDDDPVEVSDAIAWSIEHNYFRNVLPASNPLTVEDYYQGWFAVNGPGYLQAGLDHIFITLAKMEFYVDAFEPDDQQAQAQPVVPVAHTLVSGQVVINEIDPSPVDGFELYNGTAAPVDLTGWQMQGFSNGVATDPVHTYTFPAFTLQPGEAVAVHERGDVLNNGTIHLYTGTNPGAFAPPWIHGADGAAVLRNALGDAIDFVQWRAADGTPNSTAPPAGTSFSGTLDSPTAPNTIARDVSGSDADLASDFSSAHFGSLGSANCPSPQHHTIFGIGDTDLLSFQAQAGSRYGFETRGPYSKTDTRLELVSPSGQTIGANDNADVVVRDSRLDFYASDAGTYYLRVRHVGANTDWGAYDLLAFVRPVARVSAPPSGITATASNQSDAADAVSLQWVNAGAYDSVNVYRDGTLIANLPGAPGQYQTQAARGLYRYEVAGVLDGVETGRVADDEFAGIVGCHGEDDFESGNADLWMREGTNWDVTPLAASGSWGFTDSPAGVYEACTVPGCGPTSASAVFAVPSFLLPNQSLDFDQICITEHCGPPDPPCDAGIVEISTDDGTTWAEIARFDEASDARWADRVAQPGDWRHESLSLAAFDGKQILLRFRLQSDQLLGLDGWYVDNVSIAGGSCVATPVEPVASFRLQFHSPYPNPSRGSTRFSFVLPQAVDAVDFGIYAVNGRRVRYERLGARVAGPNSWTWDGLDGDGAKVGAGVYFARLIVSGQERLSRTVVKIGD